MSTPTIELISKHRSIREFSEQPLDNQTITQLINAAQMASTSNYKQAYSIIGITDPALKEALSEVAGQKHVRDNGLLLVFVADYYRHDLICRSKGYETSESFETTEGYSVAAIDAALAAQNLVLAAESLGLGACYVGSLRNDPQRIIELLELPRYTLPLFGVVLGYPAAQGSQKPRLPSKAIYHENRYQHDPAFIHSALDTYDQTINAYYDTRGAGTRSENWRDLMVKAFHPVKRQELHQIAQGQGFLQQ
ncbi:oxygen-insensitive NADPH nitroreductase [Suttonella sp. R2A3]|uniref:oxygen-insensitive NADPH nitroreductase n=1 Tax=Suttonella sp. R2A3 TaxID=2908648 RepID=UPI001F22BB85|nr:oxygen-insensitive NADPH nitroreductase [Suttonella sp. R2A3]UJF24736.1 oxygen-insensitive NADPH nitroreductase [Suttonella sp. R2A3]